MNHAQPILSDQARARRGACPTLDTPMQTGDGLLARVRVDGGVLTPAQMAELARLAAEHGNGLIEITGRGNLQVRGLRPDSAPVFAEAVAGLIAVETGLVIDVSPLAGQDPHEVADPIPLARRIRDGAAGLAGQLGPKVSVVVDGAGQVSLAALKADIRLLAQAEGRWAVTLGGGKPQVMDEPGAFAATLALLRALAALGPESRAIDLFPARAAGDPPALNLGAEAEGSSAANGWRHGFERIDGNRSIPLALPFGQVESAALVALMDMAQSENIAAIRLAPDHMMLLDNASDALVGHAAALGFITNAADPRRRISACIGNRGCASGHIAARRIAERLAAHLPAQRQLHVSGCAKGCAHPRRAEMTLVGRADGIGLVINGRAGDTPQTILDEAALAAALVSAQVGR